MNNHARAKLRKSELGPQRAPGPRLRGAAGGEWGEEASTAGASAGRRRERGDEVREVLVGGVGPRREVTSKSAILYKPERAMNYSV